MYVSYLVIHSFQEMIQTQLSSEPRIHLSNEEPKFVSPCKQLDFEKLDRLVLWLMIFHFWFLLSFLFWFWFGLLHLFLNSCLVW